jgi:hypothetical protein
MKYTFERDIDSNIIYVTVMLDDVHKFKMVLDTAASRTTFDTTNLLTHGYNVKERVFGRELVETANGTIEIDVLKIDKLTAIGHNIQNITVYAYDFLKHGILSDYDGVLGIDFFENTEIHINLKNNTIEVFE